jgi:hypothetical protein
MTVNNFAMYEPSFQSFGIHMQNLLSSYIIYLALFPDISFEKSLYYKQVCYPFFCSSIVVSRTKTSLFLIIYLQS